MTETGGRALFEAFNAGRATLNVEAFITAMIERLPLPVVARLIESVAADPGHHLRATIDVGTWHHPGARSLVADLAARLLGLFAPGERASAAALAVRVGWEMGYHPSPGMPERPTVNALLAVNHKLERIAGGAGASASLTSADLALIAFALGYAADDMTAKGEGAAKEPEVES